MAITKAELNAAVAELERRMDAKINTRVGDILTRIDREAAQAKKKRETVQEEVLEEAAMDIGDVKQGLKSVWGQIYKLESRLEKLEDSFDRFRSQYANEEFEDHDIRREF